MVIHAHEVAPPEPSLGDAQMPADLFLLAKVNGDVVLRRAGAACTATGTGEAQLLAVVEWFSLHAK